MSARAYPSRSAPAFPASGPSRCCPWSSSPANPARTPPAPSWPATRVNRTLTVTGGGTGGGIVRRPPTARHPSSPASSPMEAPAPENCVRSYGWKTAVTLTVTPDPGSQLHRLERGLHRDRAHLQAHHEPVPLRQGELRRQLRPDLYPQCAGRGTGSGTVVSQSGLSPAINCAISAGTAVSGAVHRRLSAGAPRSTLTASPLRRAQSSMAGAATAPAPAAAA